ncbi:uncharacterized protein LOC118644023 [Monomorium pharaonis]|uniref:uncharacterized protein LOC118644023 n=1 Tax=Monomorium pharaonis TaxID=307658 RepID=UPI00063FBFEF|nr:uncharacterized protein LOC118644023 [Monomorium pharaonis]
MVNENRVKSDGIVVPCCSPSWDSRHLPPEQRRFRRVHGLQLPLHPQQVAGWVLLIVVFIGTFTVLLTTPPLLPPYPDLRFILLLLFAALFLLHLSTHLTVLLLDPADPEVRARPARAIVPEFDRTRHLHVIENGRCHLCNITTRGPRTKHCSICNKCVPRFDHHCKWLNNCIGGRNYPAFLVCLVSTLVVALAVTALSLGELVLLLTVPWDSGTNGATSMSNATTAMPPLSLVPDSPGTGSLVLVIVIGVLSAIAAVLLIHLCFFHGYIACLGLTTYEYVRSKRERGVTSTGATAAESRMTHHRSTVTGGFCGMPYCTDCTAADGGEDVDGRMMVRRGLCSRFCDNGSLLDNSTNATKRTMTTTTTTTTTEEDVYVCSTHEEIARNGKDVPSKTLSPPIKGSRNFRLCFSYDSHTTETSIRVSSQTTDAELKNYGVESPDTTKSSSTPSPVSCCFSIMNASHAADGSSRLHDGRHRRRSGEPTKRSCGTMRRIQTFLQTRLRKGSRQRLTTSSLSSSSAAAAAAIARHCSNKIIPHQAASFPDSVAPGALTAENRDRSGDLVDAITTELTTENYPRPPARLPALDLSRENVRKTRKVSSNATDISVLGQMPSSAIPKRNQPHLRTRRSTSFSKKRPRFKVGSHVVSQTAQLSPIPESEFSKPATPRSPLRSASIFTFPPLHE